MDALAFLFCNVAGGPLHGIARGHLASSVRRTAPRVSLGARRHCAAMHHLKCVVDAALDGREDAHEGVVVVAVVVVGDLREAHE